MSEFPESLKAGKVGEVEILKRTLKVQPDAFIDDGTRPESVKRDKSDWDIWRPKNKYGVEVKNDYKSNYTTNLLIEMEMGGKPSALSITKAWYWVFITGIEYIQITPLELYRYLEQHPHLSRSDILGSGDTTKKRGYLDWKERIIQHVKKLEKKYGSEYGWIEPIKTNEVMYVDNFRNLNIDKYLEEHKMYLDEEFIKKYMNNL